MRSLDIAGTGMQAQQTNVEVISNNIANMTTTGFKRRRAEFQDLIYQNLRRVGSNSSDTARSFRPAHKSAWGQNRRHLPHFRAGQPAADQQQPRPGNPRERILSGHAAFRRNRLHAGWNVWPGSRRHHRHGGRLRGAARRHRPEQRHFGNDQRCRPGAGNDFRSDRAADGWPNSACGFSQRSRARGPGDNLFLQTAASGNAVTGNPSAPGFGSVMQGFIETSNVNVVSEITNLITAQRAYEMNSKVITTSNDMLSTLSNLR